MDQVKTYKDLIVWRRSMELVKEIYSIIKLLPKSETYVLVPQMLRAAISIPSNIAEGYKRNHRGEYKHFLGIANASAGELETQLLIASEEYESVDCTKALGLVVEVEKMLHVMILKLPGNS